MNGPIDERKIYIEFFTNLAVAWFTAGVISPFFTRQKDPLEIFFLVTAGMMGTAASLNFAVILLRGYNYDRN